MTYTINFFLALLMGFIFLPFWFIGNYTWVPAIQLIVSVFLFPVFLVVLNVYLFSKGQISSYGALYIAIPLACVLNQIVCYFNWGIVTRNLLKPDDETIMLLKYFVTISALLSLVLTFGGYLLLRFIKKI